MRHSETVFQGAGGINLYSQQWLPDDPPRAVIAIVHGVGEHSGRYGNVVDFMIPNQIGVLGYDLRGHGRSPGQRGHIDSWMQYRTDLLHFVEMVRAQDLGCPVFLMGHSLGALIVLDFISAGNEPGSGVILSGIPIDPVGVASPFLIAVARLLSRVWPTFPLDTGIEPAALSRIPSVVRAYEEDPLVHCKASARWGTESLSTLESVTKLEKNLDIPILIVHGEADRVNSAAGAERFFGQIRTDNTQLICYPGGCHEPHNDLDYETVLSDLLDWIDQHASTGEATPDQVASAAEGRRTGDPPRSV